MPEHTIEIRGAGAFVRLDFQHRAYPEKQDHWDGNWVVTRIQAEVPGFRADFTDQVHLGDVVRFYEEVLKMHVTLSGQATLAMMEEFLSVTGELDPRGALRWSARLARSFRSGTHLHLAWEADQSYLPELIRQLEEALIAFQVRGRT